MSTLELSTDPKLLEELKASGEAFLLYARWDWENVDKDGSEMSPECRVCRWQPDGGFYDYEADEFESVFVSVTSNPYSDWAMTPLAWARIVIPVAVVA